MLRYLLITDIFHTFFDAIFLNNILDYGEPKLMSILTNLSSSGDALTIKIIGKFQFPLASEFRRAYTDIDQVQEYTLDLKDSDYLDSSALGMIIALWEFVERNKNRIKIINANDEVIQILESANFDQLVTLP